MSRPLSTLLAGGLAVLVAVTACTSPRDEREAVLVSAASSLSDVFVEMELAFEEAHPHVDIVLNFGGSSLLREQILAGAPVDVFASANAENMVLVVEEGLASDPQLFARNLLEIAVPSGNPGAVTGLEDFGREDRLVGLCHPAVPCGTLARQALTRAGVDPIPRTNEPNARSLLTKVEAGELDAGIVYVTDIDSTGGRVEGVAIPETLNVVADYPVAVLVKAPNRTGALAFVDYLLSDRGRSIMAGHGFMAP